MKTIYTLSIIIFLSIASYADQKIAYVNLKELFEKFYKTELRTLN